jgi:tetratricopeptide (TPR) repeat protein
LAAGLRALEEARDFQPSGSELEAALDLPRLISAHRTPVLHNKPIDYLTPLAALQAYHAYAEDQLALAGGHELVSADALYGLARLQDRLAISASDQSQRQGPVSMSLYQAALMIYPDHYLAANELGVLFARYGQLTDAREVLRHAVSISPSFPESWLNLSRVHERLGETTLAQRAHNDVNSDRQTWRHVEGALEDQIWLALFLTTWLHATRTDRYRTKQLNWNSRISRWDPSPGFVGLGFVGSRFARSCSPLLPTRG